MNIRYADTPSQKELKRVTAERRQFRTNEYNIGAYGTPLVGLNPTLYNQQSQWRRSIPQSRRYAVISAGVNICPNMYCSGLSASSNGESGAMRHSGAARGPSEYASRQTVFSSF